MRGGTDRCRGSAGVVVLAAVAVIVGGCLAVGALRFGGYLRHQAAGTSAEPSSDAERPGSDTGFGRDSTLAPDPRPSAPHSGAGHPTPPVCPPGPTIPAYSGTGLSPGELIPFEPADGVLCSYGAFAAQGPRLQGSRPLDRTQANRFRAELNALPAVRPGDYACPADDGSAYAVILEVDGTARTVWVKRSGCHIVTDGSHLRRPSAGLGNLLAHLGAG